jgi:hypothetical protein
MLTRNPEHFIDVGVRTRIVAARDGADVLEAARALADEVRRAEGHPLDSEGVVALACADTMPPPREIP